MFQGLIAAAPEVRGERRQLQERMTLWGLVAAAAEVRGSRRQEGMKVSGLGVAEVRDKSGREG